MVSSASTIFCRCSRSTAEAAESIRKLSQGPQSNTIWQVMLQLEGAVAAMAEAVAVAGAARAQGEAYVGV